MKYWSNIIGGKVKIKVKSVKYCGCSRNNIRCSAICNKLDSRDERANAFCGRVGGVDDSSERHMERY